MKVLAIILINYYPDAAHATAEFCKFLDIFFDCLNVRNQYEGNTKKVIFPYREIDDARYIWFENEFLLYLDNWKESTENRPGNFFSECSIEDVSSMADI